MPYLAYQLTPESRQKILKKFPPKYPVVKYDHITIQMCGTETPLPLPADSVQIIGMADDGRGLQVFLVKINGSSVRPTDQKFWHLTASYDSTKMAPACFDDSENSPKERPYRSKTSNGFLCQILDAQAHLKQLQNPQWQVQIFNQPITIQTVVKKKYTSDELNKIQKEK